MFSSLVTAVLAGLSGMLGWGTADFFAKKTIDEIGDVATLTVASIIGAFALLIIDLGVGAFSSHKIVLPTSGSEYLLLALFGIFQAIVYLLVYRAFAVGKLSIVNPIFSSYSGLVVLLSVFIFSEVIGALQFVLIGVVFLGILVMSLDEESFALRKLKLTKLPGVNEVLLGAILAAFWTVFWGNFINGKDWLAYASIMFIFMAIMLLLVCFFQKTSLQIKQNKLWKFLIFIGLGEIIAYVGVSIGYSLTSHVSIVGVLSAAFSVPTLILAYFFLGERLNKFQKIGVVLVIVGVSLLPLL